MNEFDYDLTDIESEFFATGDQMANEQEYAEPADDVPALSLWQRLRRTSN